MDIDLSYSCNNLINTPLWNLIQEKLNGVNLRWEDAKASQTEGRKNIRKTKVAWLGDNYLRECLFNSINLFNQQHWNYDLAGCDEIQYGIYSDGGHYNWHSDIETIPLKIDDKIFCRKLSMTIWLNDPDEYEGGEFDIEVEGPYKDLRYNTLKLSKGSIIIFPSDKWHRVRPVTSGERKSLVTWFRGPPFR